MDKNIEYIKEELGTGSINVFGMPFSGKDTVGIRLAEALGGKFLSSGLILRAAAEEDEDLKKEMSEGNLATTDKFRDIVLPYFYREDLADYPLVLSSIGRWDGEEEPVIEAAKNSNHPIRAVILLNISEEDTHKRWRAARQNDDRGERDDDAAGIESLRNRIHEFNEKTMPVIVKYRDQDLLVSVKATGTREEVFVAVIEALANKLQSKERVVTLE